MKKGVPPPKTCVVYGLLQTQPIFPLWSVFKRVTATNGFGAARFFSGWPRLVLSVLLIGLPPATFAAGTGAGTQISNTATATYSIAAVVQPPVSSNISQFRVDRRINLTVAEIGSIATSVVPGASARVLAFTVTNSSNATLDFRLVATQDASGSTTAFARTDNFDVIAPQVFVDVNANGIYEAGVDTATFIDELPADGSRTVFIVATMPGAVVNGDTAGLTLTAVAAQSTDGTGNHVPTPGVLSADAIQNSSGVADNGNFTDTVFGDAAGDTDAARDGRHSDDDEYVVASVVTVLNKSQSVLDQFGGNNPIPGATITYLLTFNVSGAGSVTGAQFVDPIPAGTTYVPGSLNLDSVSLSDAADADAGRFTGSQIEVNLGTVTAPASRTVTFRVTIN